MNTHHNSFSTLQKSHNRQSSLFEFKLNTENKRRQNFNYQPLNSESSDGGIKIATSNIHIKNHSHIKAKLIQNKTLKIPRFTKDIDDSYLPNDLTHKKEKTLKLPEVNRRSNSV